MARYVTLKNGSFPAITITELLKENQEVEGG